MATVMNHRPLVREPAANPLLLENGDHLDQPTFHRLYEAMPAGFKCELIGGVAYVMASPLKYQHGFPHAYAIGWLFIYSAATPGTDLLDNTSHILGNESEPQPDATLFVRPECNGASRLGENGYVVGSVGLPAEAACTYVTPAR